MAKGSAGGRFPMGDEPDPFPRTTPTRPPPLPKAAAAPRDAVGAAAIQTPPVSSLMEWRGRIFRGARHCGRAGFYTLVPLFLLVALATGVFYVRLRHGPIAFDSVVAPIQRGINAELIGSSVKIGGAELRLGDGGDLEFRLRDVSILDAVGQSVLASPLAAVNLSMPALLHARIVPARIELIDPVIKLAYSEERGLEFDRAGSSTSIRSEPEAAAEPQPQATTLEKKSDDASSRVNLAKMLSDASRRARQRLDAASYLTEFGISNATVVVEYAGSESSWRIDEASIDLNHRRRRSIISGHASIASERGPWAFSFVTDESEKTNKLRVKASVRDLVPSTLAAAAPPLALLGMVALPISADATIELNTAGEVASSDVTMEVGAGYLAPPGLSKPLDVSAGVVRLAYDGASRRWALDNSPVKWADGTLLLAGEMKDVASAGEPPQWQFALNGTNGVFEAEEFGVPPVSIDTWHAEGSIVPRRGEATVSNFQLSGGGGSASATLNFRAGPAGLALTSQVKLSAMPLATLKALWPRGMGAGARNWVGHNVSAVDFKGGLLNYTSIGTHDATHPPAPGTEKLAGTLEADNTVFQPLQGMPSIESPRAVIQFQDNAMEIAVADAAIALSSGHRLPIKNARILADDVMIPRTNAQIDFTTEGALADFIDAVEVMPVRAVEQAKPLPKAGEGKVEAHLELKLPLIPGLQPDDISIAGKARITDGRFGKVAGRFDVQGFSLDLDLSQTSLAAKGDLLVNGVPAKIVGERLLSVSDAEQPPIKIVANLDEADRKQLGFDVNDIVHGTVPIEISWQKGDRPEPAIKIHADLTAAEIALDQIQWRKAAGRQATLETDVVGGQSRPTELQNFKITSDDIAAEGTIQVGTDNKLKSFKFPDVALNFVSRLSADGSIGKDDVWAINVKSSTFDGRNMFKSMFTVNGASERDARAKSASAGARVNAEIDTLIGGSDVSMRKVKLSMSTRGGKLTSLDARGTVDGGGPFAAVVDPSNGGRRLLVDSADAGQMLKLVNFYPNMQGGRLRLEVNLDGEGAADKTGILWVENFRVLGDPIVSEVVSSGDQGRPAIQGNRTVTREVFEFDRMRAPFSIGYGQFVLNESYLKGPLVGANLRGKVDFKTKRVNLGGTYIPLQGLNGALGGIPLLGQILSGAQGEGIFGITFAVQGDTSDPQVIVNPISLVAPGIFREMFQMTSANPQVQVRDEPEAEAPPEKRTRASSTSANGSAPKKKSSKGAKDKAPAQSGVVDGWSANVGQ